MSSKTKEQNRHLLVVNTLDCHIPQYQNRLDMNIHGKNQYKIQKIWKANS